MEKQNAGEAKVPARKPGAGALEVLEDAPGSYASLRLGNRGQAPIKS
jgi:poly(3-hydroxyalkanoate) synthetase